MASSDTADISGMGDLRFAVLTFSYPLQVSQGFGCLKLADFGSAFRETDPDNEPTPYLVSRWYVTTAVYVLIATCRTTVCLQFLLHHLKR